jgi:seryl-tRNA synthetase
MIDIRLLRHNPEVVKQAMQNLGSDIDVDALVELDRRRRDGLAEVEKLKGLRNKTSEEINRLKKAGLDASDKIAEMRAVGDRIKSLDEKIKSIEEELNTRLLEVPNLPDPSVPAGPDESANVVIRTEGTPREFDFEPKAHWELGPALDIIDFERGVKMSGSRFYLLKGWGAKLQRALIQFFLDTHTTENGYTEIYPPVMVKEHCLWNAGQLPKFRDNIYHDAEEDFWWTGTAEVTLTNLHADEILDLEQLPARYVAYTPCFRREKMSAGRDVRGIKRGHQFDKVEQYALTTPETSNDELERILNCAENLCRKLGIPHRVVQMCTGDLGFVAAKKYDVEVWAPGCGEWLEVSSCSNCTDFQARRANIRFRREPKGKPEYVHTLNGSGLALPRTVIAILENYQNADGSVTVPGVLRGYMGGVEVIHL